MNTPMRAIIGVVLLGSTMPVLAAESDPPKKWYDTITLKGYVQMDAVFPEGKSTAGQYSNFRIRRARPTIVAQIDPDTKVQLQFDVGTGKSGSGASTASVTDTFIERKIGDKGSVMVGQYLIPFCREITEDNAAVRSPLELCYAAERIALSERDLGITVKSPAPRSAPFYWEGGIYNGQGFRTADANSNKTLMAHATAAVAPQVRVGVSGLYGKYRSGGVDYDRNVLAGELHVEASPVVAISGEIYNAHFVDDPTAVTQKVTYTGGYLMAEGKVDGGKSVPFVRYQRTYGDLDYRSFDFGWRYHLTPKQRLTVQYDMVRKARSNSVGARWQVNF